MFTNQFSSFSFALLRTPSLPWNKSFLQMNLPDIQYYETLPLFEEALYIASPNFYNLLKRSVNDKFQQDSDKDKKKMALALYKYAIRMSYRCTPFGLFAGVAPVRFAEKNTIKLQGVDEGHRVCRIDMRYLIGLIKELEDDYSLRSHLYYKINPTALIINDKCIYIENIENKGYNLVSVDISEQLKVILELAVNECKCSSLVESIQSHEISGEDAKNFINEVIDAQLLLGPSAPTLTGEDYINYVLKKYQHVPGISYPLSKLGSLINNINSSLISRSVDSYELVRSWSKTQFKIGEQASVTQTDLLRTFYDNSLNKNVVQELISSLNLLSRIPIEYKESSIDRFKIAFSNRYEEREMPLLEVLDPEHGIGYPISQLDNDDGSDFLHGINLELNDKKRRIYTNSSWHEFINNKYAQAILQQSDVIQLSYKECEPYLRSEHSNLPYSMYSYVSLLSESNQSIDEGNFMLVHKITAGPSAVHTMNRFAYLSKELTQNLQTIADEEQAQYSNSILVDILHPGKEQTVNVMRRPSLREYELPIFATISKEKPSVEISDLMISIRNNKVRLRSKKFNKEVFPFLSSAYLYRQEDFTIYTFLGDLQYQFHQNSLSWQWYSLENSPYLPRVQYERTILSKARWRIYTSQINAASISSISQFTDYIEAIKFQLKIPNKVTVLEGEDELPIDLDSRIGLMLLWDSWSRSKADITLYEDLIGDKQWLNDDLGSYNNELVIPLRNNLFLTPEFRPETDNLFPIQREFLPGSEWCYLKIVCGPNSVDRILTEVIRAESDRMLKSGIWKKWFFVRYRDDNFHLRIRILCAPESAQQATKGLLKNISQFNEKHKLISSIDIKTYVRELERYGPECIEDIETIFFYQSELCLSIMDTIHNDEQSQVIDDKRWLIVIAYNDLFLSCAGISDVNKTSIMNKLQLSFKQEFNLTGPATRKKFADKFRKQRFNISEVLSKQGAEWVLPYKLLISNFCDNAGPIISKVLNKTASSKHDQILSDIIHMFVNKMLKSQHRRYELVIYDMAHQYYLAKQHREKYMNP